MKLFLFDIDGTILQLKMGKSRIIFADVFFDVFAVRIEQNRIPNFAGMTDLQILFELGTLASIPYDKILSQTDLLWKKLLDRFREVCNSEHLEIFPGVEELVENLSNDPNIQLALLTGNFRENAYLKLANFGLDKYFPFGAFGSDNRQRNELPAIAIKRANVFVGKSVFNINNTLIIGDGPREVACAKANGIKVACVATGHHSIEELNSLNPDHLFKNFADWENVKKLIC